MRALDRNEDVFDEDVLEKKKTPTLVGLNRSSLLLMLHFHNLLHIDIAYSAQVVIAQDVCKRYPHPNIV